MCSLAPLEVQENSTGCVLLWLPYIGIFVIGHECCVCVRHFNDMIFQVGYCNFKN